MKNKKAGVPVKSHRYKHEINIKNTTVLALTRCPLRVSKKKKENKNKADTQRMTGKSCLFHLTNGFRFCSLWQKRKPSRDQETSDSESVSSYVQSIVNMLARRNEGTSVAVSILRGSTFTVSAQGCGRRKEGKRNRKGGDKLNVARGLKTHKHTPALLQIKSKTWESRNLREVDTGFCTGAAGMKENWGFWVNS